MSRVRAYVGLAIACVLGFSFASCGGGGGGGTMNPPPGPSPTPSPTPSPFVCPTGGCTAFTLAGTSTQTVTRTNPLPPPPPLVVVSAIGESVAVRSGKTFHAKPATDYNATETDTAPTQTITTNTDNYIQFPASTGNIVNIGYASTDSNGVTLDVQYTGANGIIGQVPCCTGWVNTAASIINETDPDGTTLTENIAANGSFTLTKTETIGVTTETENSDATGTATMPIVGFFGAGVGTATKITIPVQSGGSINFTLTAVGAPAPTPAPIVIPVGAWYTPSQPMATDTTSVVGVTAIPAGCAAAVFGSTGLQLTQQETRYDVVFGIQDTETTNSWVTGAGPVCQRIGDTINIYYDFTNQSGGVLLGGPSPIQTNAISETIGLQTASRADSARHALGAGAFGSSFTTQLVGARQRIDRWRLAIRDKQIAKLQNLLKRGNPK